MKKWASTNWIAIVALIISGLSIICSISNKADNSTNKARIEDAIRILKTETLSEHERDSLIYQIQLQAFKEDFYINQLGIQSDWIILYVTVLFGIFGIIGYAVFYKEMQQIQDDYKNFKIEYEEHFDEILERLANSEIELEKKFEELESQLSVSFGNTFSTTSTFYAEDKDFASAFVMIIYCIDNFILAKRKNNDNFNKNLQKTIDANLKNALHYIQQIADDDKVFANSPDNFWTETMPSLKSILDTIIIKSTGESVSDIVQIKYILEGLIEKYNIENNELKTNKHAS